MSWELMQCIVEQPLATIQITESNSLTRSAGKILYINMTQEKRKADLGNEYLAWKQVYEREKRFFYIRTKFVANLKDECITGKFYANHDVVCKEEADQNFVKMIKEKSTRGPKDQSEHPVTENQRYGWYPELQPVQKFDPRLYHGHHKSHITWLAEQILLGTRDMPKPPPFTGVPFKT